MPTAPAAPAPAATPPKGYKQADDVPKAVTDFVEAMLDAAEALEDEKKELHERIGANRDALRGQVKMRQATPEQAGEVEKFYPTRTRETKPDEDKGNGNASS